MASEAVLHDLALLLHAIRLERLTWFDRVAVWTRADPEFAMEQIAELVDCAPAEVPQESPRLILAAVSQLVRQNGQIAAAAIGQKDMVAQRHRTMPAQPQDDRPQQT
jgi:hypothetical protein